MELLVDDLHGRYVPQELWERYRDEFDLPEADYDEFESIMSDPDHEAYWEAFEELLSLPLYLGEWGSLMLNESGAVLWLTFTEAEEEDEPEDE